MTLAESGKRQSVSLQIVSARTKRLGSDEALPSNQSDFGTKFIWARWA